MKCHFVLAAVLAAVALQGSLSLGAANDLIAETTANRHGLTRPWFAQVDLDAAQGRVRDVVLDRGVLFVQTDRARIHAIDAETGHSIWSKQVGRANHPSMTPGVNDKLLVSVNGSRLYALNRYTGELLYETEMKGGPGAGPAVSSSRAYVPMVSGMVMAYRLEPLTDARKELGIARHEEGDEPPPAETTYENLRLRQDYISPLACQSAGRTLVQPIILRDTKEEEFTCWPTDSGFLNIGYIDKRAAKESFTIRYRKEGVVVSGKPAILSGSGERGAPGTIFFGARDGFVYAISEKSGDELWRFSAGDRVMEPVVRIGDRVYATTQLGGLFCLEVKPTSPAGGEIWFAPKIVRFLAASKQRIYALDHLGRFVMLDAATGARLDSLPIGDASFTVMNSESDRVYLVTKTGLAQCLHEIELTEPIKHNAVAEQAKGDEADEQAPAKQPKKPGGSPTKKPGKKPGQDAEAPDGEAPDAGGPNPFEGGEKADPPADAGDNPFGS